MVCCAWLPAKRWLTLPLLALLAACNLLAAPDAGEQTVFSGPPAVRLASPLPNAVYMEGVTVNIQAQITNAGPDIDRVEVVVDGTIIAALQNPNAAGAPAFSIAQAWPAAGAGPHSISVTAFRADGASSPPATVSITVVSSAQMQPTNTPAPAGGQPTPAPTDAQGNQGAQTAPTNPPPPTEPPPPTLTPTPSKPTATFIQGVNVRAGPSTLFNPPIGSFAANQTTDILARTPAGDWYKVRYYNGEGWVFGQLLTVSGDQSQIPVDPGPPPPTLTPTPIPVTPTPVTTANLVAGNFRFEPGSPQCNQTFNIFLDVANLGTGPTASGGTITIQDFAVRDGALTQTTTGVFPVLQPGQTFTAGPIPITISTYVNEEHRLVMTVNGDNLIPETERGDNVKEARYTLGKGSCP